MKTRASLRLALVAVLLSTAVLQANAAGSGAPAELYPEIVHSSHFLHYHPDLRHRRDGFLALDRGALDMAVRYFRKSAWYGDKASQAMLADLYWRGHGVTQDRALAYAWMDLAAERGYPDFVGFRERYWAALTPDDRARAVDAGRGIYDDYGDAVARQRMEHMLRKGRMDYTGSRVGYVPFGLEVLVPSPTGGWLTVPEDKAYAKHHWHAREYFAWQDAIFRAPVRGEVEVGPLRDAVEDDD